MASQQIDKSTDILIIGGGTFGASAALSIATAGFTNVTLLERSDDGSVNVDGASHDWNKVVRHDFSRVRTTTFSLRCNLIPFSGSITLNRCPHVAPSCRIMSDAG